MRKNYFAKLARYMKNFYHLERGLNKLSDGRVNPTYSTGEIREFDEEIFRRFVNKVRVQSMVELEFMFKAGVKVRELLT